MIEALGLTKRYGGKTAVDDLSFTIRSGKVTGFLGPNGAGKPNIGIRHFFGRAERRRVAGLADDRHAGLGPGEPGPGRPVGVSELGWRGAARRPGG
jgi:hypothetical protein